MKNLKLKEMAKQNNQTQTGGQEKPIIKTGRETPAPTPPQDVKEK